MKYNVEELYATNHVATKLRNYLHELATWQLTYICIWKLRNKISVINTKASSEDDDDDELKFNDASTLLGH